MNEPKHPVWLRRLLGCLVGVWVLLLVMMVSLVMVISLVDEWLPGEGIPGLPGLAVALVCLAFAIWSTVRFVRWMNAILARHSLRTHYVVLAVVLLFTLLSFPAPFSVLTFE